MALRAFLLVLGLVLAIAGVFAQDLAVPSSWGTTTSKDTRAAREAYANGAARALVSRIGPGNGSLPDQSNGQALASMYATLALSDLLSGNKTWQDAVIGGMQNWTGKNDIYTNGTAGSQRTNTNGMQWALAYYYAYKAYGQQSFLALAQNAWDKTYGQYITQKSVAAKPNVPGRNVSFNGSDCFDDTAVGGVFWLPDQHDDAQIQTDAVGPFAVLAGYLYETTKNETYKTAGLASTQFLGSYLMYNSTLNYVNTEQDLHDCSYWDYYGPGLQGWYIQPLSIWANITGDSALTQSLRQVVSSTAHTNLWTEGDGVLLDPGTTFSENVWDDKAILVRALGEVLRRFPSSSDLANFIEAFITVQYNVLTSNARADDSYSTTIFGPAPQAFSSNGNILAMDVLNAAFDMLPHDSTATSSPPSATSSSQTSSVTPSSSTPVGAIAGGAVAGAIALAALIGTLLWFRRTRRRPGPMRQPHDDGAAEPFMAVKLEPFMDEHPGATTREATYSSSASHYDPWAAGRATAPVTAGPSTGILYLPPGAATADAHPKLARMNAPPPAPPSSEPPAVVSPLPASNAPSGSRGGSGSGDAAQNPGRARRPERQGDIPELVRGLVDNLLREHGAAPPRYDG